MCVVGHGCRGLGGGRDRGGAWYACVTKRGRLAAYREMPETSRVRGDAPMTPITPPSRSTALGISRSFL